MGPRLDPLLPEPILFAHRGGCAHAPENTLEAFELALRLGATGLETDVWITRDRVPVLVHDGTVRRGLRRVPIADLDRSDLPASVPTVDELYEVCGDRVPVAIDLKDPAAAAATIGAARRVGPTAVEQLWLFHPDHTALAELRPLAPDVRLVDSTSLSAMKEGPEVRAATLREAGVDGVNLRHDQWTGGLTTLFHRFSLVAMAWDAQHERMIDAVLRMGIDAVFGDHVDRLVDSAARFHARGT